MEVLAVAFSCLASPAKQRSCRQSEQLINLTFSVVVVVVVVVPLGKKRRCRTPLYFLILKVKEEE